MSFESLVNSTFVLGTGANKASAINCPRYHQLKSELPHIPYLSSSEVAEMVLLGERLADRAFFNLPWGIQYNSRVWADADETIKVDILFDLVNRCQDFRRPGSVARRVGEALPDQRPSHPNCLGMLQMLIGFARATGAPHMLMDALYRYDVYGERYRYIQIGKLLDLIAPYEDFADIAIKARKMRKYRLRIAKSLAKNERTDQAHHMLVIRTDEAWWVVDPYFQVCCELESPVDHIDKVYRRTIEYPQHASIQLAAPHQRELQVKFEMKALEKYLPTLRRLNEPRTAWTFRDQGIRCIVEALLGFDRSDNEEEYQQRVDELSVLAFYPVVKRMSDSKETIDIDECFLRTLRSKRFRNQSFRRLMVALVRTCFADITEVHHSDDTPPLLREYGNPALGLAVRTVNHLAFLKGVDAPQLLKYSASQWILHDTLAAAEGSGDKRLQKLAERRINELQRQSDFALSELRPYLLSKG